MHPFQKFHPFLEPGWRQARVLSLVDAQPRPLMPSRRIDDTWICNYRKFLIKWRLRDSDDGRLTLASEFPHLAYAHIIYHHPDREWRTVIEACLLAGMTNEEIARDTSTTPEAIEAFANIFYDVRPRLDAEIYITKTILGRLEERRSSQEGRLTDAQWPIMLRLFAYFGGQHALKLLLSGFRKNGKPRKTEDVAAWFDTATVDNIRRSAAIKARTFETDRYTVMQLLELHVRLIEAAANRQEGGPQTEFEKNIAAAIEHLPEAWSVGKAGMKKLTPALAMFHETAVELRADEMMMAAVQPDGLNLSDTQLQNASSLYDLMQANEASQS